MTTVATMKHINSDECPCDSCVSDLEETALYIEQFGEGGGYCESCDGIEGLQYCPECHRVDQSA